MPRLPDPFAHAWTDTTMPCAVIDIQSELRFWEETYACQPFHRPGTPFRYYVPTLKFAYDAYLLSRRCSLQQLLPALRADPSAVLLADGFSCRTQALDLAGRAGVHLAQLLA